MEPAQSEVHRYLAAANNMLISVFEDVYGLSFESFKLWDLVSNIDLRNWLRESEEALKDGDPRRCIGACNHAHALIIGAIRNSTKPYRFRGHTTFSLDTKISGSIARFRKEIIQEIEFLENEVVAIGVGLPLMDTRRFQKAGSSVLIFVSADGQMQSRSSVANEDRSQMAKGAEFMLDYLSRLIRLLDEAYPGVLESIKIPLSLEESWSQKNRAASTVSGE
jgi:hypothetical protein